MRHNLERRNLDSGQRAAIGVEYKTRFAVLAKERQGARNDLKPNIVEKIPQCENAEESKARAQAAAAVGSNPRYIDYAEKIKDNAPDVFEALKQGVDRWE